MPSSPRTPIHSRQPSALDFSPSNINLSRRLSKSSIHTPTTPNHMIRDFSASVDSVGIGMDVLGSAQNGGNGLGNLADELADAWSEDEGEELEEGDLNFQNTAASDSDNEDREGENNHPVRDSGVDVTSPKKQQGVINPNLLNLTPPVGGHGRIHALGHARTPSEYDGSDYGGDSDLESPAFGPALLARMDMVEGLARRGTENNGSQADGVVKRVIESLRDLGGQSGVEGNTTRLVTTHTALSTHLLHQTRLLQNLSHPLFSPLSAPPTPEFIDTLLPLLDTLSDSIPRPTAASLTSITSLHSLTTDLVQTITYLSDTLHMSRQTTVTASRKLKSAKELVAEMRRDEELREEGEQWVESGDWQKRLGDRECAGVCRGVVGGFEQVCDDWRRRLVESAGGEVGA
ncbi:6e2e2efb-b363-46dd-b1cb-257619a42bd1 [Sclerotinia trifoliorum]|uniref:6e2e2efb-b363-46dd-b1cb-257619a42bd1 n=1 Tax=Sclerotinia trifoliorum TaxID=28548 RepID=A0A8H2W0R3_9HELO|nr:6e2e2efb-b363-46dd-b1cb-257619a42bd1 [Sclerotinia trifoliorum]